MQAPSRRQRQRGSQVALPYLFLLIRLAVCLSVRLSVLLSVRLLVRIPALRDRPLSLYHLQHQQRAERLQALSVLYTKPGTGYPVLRRCCWPLCQ